MWESHGLGRWKRLPGVTQQVGAGIKALASQQQHLFLFSVSLEITGSSLFNYDLLEFWLDSFQSMLVLFSFIFSQGSRWFLFWIFLVCFFLFSFLRRLYEGSFKVHSVIEGKVQKFPVCPSAPALASPPPLWISPTRVEHLLASVNLPGHIVITQSP